MLTNIVALARTGHYGDASSLINRVLQKIQPALLSSSPVDEHTRKIVYSCETIMLMQEQRDWVGVADVIEFELARLIEPWVLLHSAPSPKP